MLAVIADGRKPYGRDILPPPNTTTRVPADNPYMMLRRLTRRVAQLALVLALWMALPSVEWCPFAWANCVGDVGESAACETSGACEISVACETSGACKPLCTRMASGTISPNACEASSACATTTAACPLPCDPSADALPFGDRAWCVHPPVEALVVSPLQVQPPPVSEALATLVPALDVRPPVSAAPRAITAVFRSPVLLAPHAPPLGRAPPSSELITRS